MEYYISGCKIDCPFFKRVNDGIITAFTCNHPSEPNRMILSVFGYKEPDYPNWCPLISEHTSIHLKQPTV